MQELLPSNLQFTHRGNRKDIPLVFIHGFCESDVIWDNWLSGFPPNLHHIRIGLPGFTEQPSQVREDIPQLASGIRRLLQESLQSGPFILCGHSMGGYIALEIAASTHFCQGLILFHSHPFPDSEERKEARRKQMESIRLYGPQPYVSTLIRSLFHPVFQDKHPELIAELIARANSFSAETLIHYLDSMIGRKDHSDTLRDLPYPVLLICGKQDPAVPYEISMRSSLLPGQAQVLSLDPCAHMGMYEFPELTRQAVLQYRKEFGLNSN